VQSQRAPDAPTVCDISRRKLSELQHSACAIDVIKKFEHFEPNLYLDGAGNCTIGYGHKLHDGGCNDDDRAQYPNPPGIDMSTADQLLAVDVAKTETRLHALIPPTTELTQAQYDALVSFEMNCQSCTAKLLRNDQTGQSPDFERVESDLPKFVLDNRGQFEEGLKRRRCAELVLYRSGNPNYETGDRGHNTNC
jgi:lysozyme